MSVGAEDAEQGGRWVGVASVAARYEGVLTPAQRVRAATFIRDAESTLRDRVPRIGDRIVADTIEPLPPGGLRFATVERVVCQAVIRALQPGGGLVAQRSAGEGPFNESKTFVVRNSGPERTGGVQFTDEELDDLREQNGPAGFGVVHQSIPAWRVP